MKLNVKAFALAGGIVWGLNWFGLTWWYILTVPRCFVWVNHIK